MNTNNNESQPSPRKTPSALSGLRVPSPQFVLVLAAISLFVGLSAQQIWPYLGLEGDGSYIGMGLFTGYFLSEIGVDVHKHPRLFFMACLASGAFCLGVVTLMS